MFYDDDNDDDDSYDPLFANGSWCWDDDRNELEFRSNSIRPYPALSAMYVPPALVSVVDFKIDLDVVEQQRFRRRFQRRPEGQDDVVRLQDVKDLVLYCSPGSLLNATVISALHKATTERLMRALILYCQYYLQVTRIMEKRTFELKTKIPTDEGAARESVYRENLDDLRRLVAKEYSTMILAFDDLRKFHHMGKNKQTKSSTKKDSLLYESLIRIIVQIVWVALGRKSHNVIEMEINRLFRTKKFNTVERKLHVDMDEKMSAREYRVLRGDSIKPGHVKPLQLRSPLYEQLHCDSGVDFRMLGLGVIKYDRLNERLQYFNNVLTRPETDFPELGINLGIIGLLLSRFDTMLRDIYVPEDDDKSGAAMRKSITGKVSRTSASSRMSKKSITSSKKSITSSKSLSPNDPFPPIAIPPKITDSQIDKFPMERMQRFPISKGQEKKWVERHVKKIARKLAAKRETDSLNEKYSW